MFMLFATFGLMNATIGMIVNGVMQNARQMQAESEEREHLSKLDTLRQLEELVCTIDKNGDGRVTVAELNMSLQNSCTKSLRQQVNVPRDITAPELLAMLDDDGDGYSTRDKLVSSFYWLVDGDDFQRACLCQWALTLRKT